ncbi:MAG: DUF418 domain-containing protein [Bacteroidota bacterium]
MNQIKPTSQSDRITSLDFLRGIAVLGILFINIESFAYPDPWSPWKFGFETEIDRETRFWVYFLTQGKFYNMFALLFGVSFYIFLERLEKKNVGLKAMDIYARRLLWLFAIGIIHAYFIWDGDVLYHYSICGFLLFPFRSLKKSSLILAIGILMGIGLSNSLILTSKRKKSYEKFVKAKTTPIEQMTPEQDSRNEYWTSKLKLNERDTTHYEAPKAYYLQGLQDSYNHSKVHKGVVYHSGLLFPTLLIMIVGMILYRSGVFHNYRTWKHYWLISLSILTLGLSINYLRYYQWTFEYNVPVISYWKTVLFSFPKEILGLGYILILNGLYQRFFRSIKVNLISKIGRTALTNYIFQNILLGLFFYGYGFSKFNQYSRFELLGIVVIVWVIQIVFTFIWLSIFNQGPLETLWRKLTYGGFTSENEHDPK